MDEIAAAAWDAWLEGEPLGQFQQTTRWARCKAMDGWMAERILLDSTQPGRGGAQLLWKPTRLGRMGYVPKGPVIPGEDPGALAALFGLLETRARAIGLRAMIVQPPDQSRIATDFLVSQKFNPQPMGGVIRATATIDLRGGRAAWEPRMHSKTRQQARAALKRGVTIRAGGRDELPLFFSLMCESCRRQNTRPNPGRVEALTALWDAFTPHARLGFADVEGETIAGLLMIGHGPRLTFWKKGWNSRGAQLYANCLLMVECLEWATNWGYALVDFAGLDHMLADTLLRGEPLNEAQQRGRDMFNLRLGADPQLVPPAQLMILNPVLRQLHRLATAVPAIERKLMQGLGRV